MKSAQITQGLVEVLGMKPFLGRMFTKAEDRAGADRTVVLSYGFWKRQFGGDRNLIGKDISLSGNSYSVIGVLPENFELPQDKHDVWALVRIANPIAAQYRGVHFLRTMGLLKKGVSLDQARAEMKLIDRSNRANRSSGK